MAQTTSAQYSLTLRVRIDHRPGMLGRVASAIGEAGGTIGNIVLVEASRDHVLRDLTIDAGDEAHERGIVEAVRGVEGAAGRRLDRPHARAARRRQARGRASSTR